MKEAQSEGLRSNSIQRVLFTDDISSFYRSGPQKRQSLKMGKGGPPTDGVGKDDLLPSLDQLKWHILRESIYAEWLGRSQPQCIGVKKDKSFMIWMLDHKWDCLRVLVSHFADIQTGVELLNAACLHAGINGLSECRMWESDGREVQILGGNTLGQVLRVKREDSIAMIHPLSTVARARSWRGIQRGIWI